MVLPRFKGIPYRDTIVASTPNYNEEDRRCWQATYDRLPSAGPLGNPITYVSHTDKITSSRFQILLLVTRVIGTPLRRCAR